jgi:hypothetical protein
VSTNGGDDVLGEAGVVAGVHRLRLEVPQLVKMIEQVEGFIAVIEAQDDKGVEAIEAEWTLLATMGKLVELATTQS